jgi:chitin disaccharide deacetylase
VKSLIVTADDFGASPQVNEAVERAHRDGILTAASLMVAGPAAADAVARAKRMPGLRVGLHLTLVDDRPTLPAAEIPGLVDRDGMFRPEMARSGVAMFFLPAVRRQLASEIEAQFRAFAATGLRLDHVNSHRHFHLHPTVAAKMVEIGRGFGMNATRVPFETDNPLAVWLRRRYRAQGMLVADRVYGLKWSGAMTRERLQSLLDALPEGLSEIYMHPATGPYPGSAEGYRYAEELEALLAARTGIRRGGFTDFAPANENARLPA